MAGAVGRPRKNNSRRRGNTAREESLDASAELFTTQGFATTSTHQIADAVGIRQASLYYHFPSKTEIFLALLTSTVTPSTALAAKFEEIDVPAPLRLWALTAAECRLLLSTRWNVGRLYQLPVASSPEFSEYHQQRTQLQAVFRSIAAKIVGPNDGVAPEPLSATRLPSLAIMLADAALAVLGAPLPENRLERTLELLADMDS